MAEMFNRPGGTGAQGVQGKSAYEVAVQEGFNGSSADWLTSLKGADGVIGVDGLSAYELAVQQGFVGTVDAWLASLVGADGAPGADGAKGDTGATGAAGANGSPDTPDEVVAKVATSTTGGKYLGIGTVTPDRPLVISTAGNLLAAGSSSIMLEGENNKERFELRSYRGAGTGPQPTFQGMAARGYKSAPEAVTNNTNLFSLIGFGWNGTAYGGSDPVANSGSALIGMYASETHSTTAKGSYIAFQTTATGTTSRTEKLRIHGSGEITIGAGTLVVGTTGITPEGGFYTCYTAGEALVAGDVVHFPATGAADAVTKCPTSGSYGDRPCGIVYDGAANGAVVKIIWGGRAAVYCDAAPTKGDILTASATNAGRATSTTGDPTSVHWREVGHYSGASVSKESRTLYYIGNVHFN